MFADSSEAKLAGLQEQVVQARAEARQWEERCRAEARQWEERWGSATKRVAVGARPPRGTGGERALAVLFSIVNLLSVALVYGRAGQNSQKRRFPARPDGTALSG